MAQRVADKVTLATVVELSFQGGDPSKIAAELKLSLRLVHQTLERLEAAMLLIAHDFPPHFFSKVMRVKEAEACVYLDAVRKHFGKNERVREYLEAEKVFEPPANSEAKGPEATSPEKEAEVTSSAGDEAAHALEVLDFWASKWL